MWQQVIMFTCQGCPVSIRLLLPICIPMFARGKGMAQLLTLQGRDQYFCCSCVQSLL